MRTPLALLSLRYDWLTGEYVTMGMAGAFIPDMAKIKLLVDSATVEAARHPFDWLGVHTLGGAFVAVLVGAVVVNRSDRRRVVGLLSLGAASHQFAERSFEGGRTVDDGVAPDTVPPVNSGAVSEYGHLAHGRHRSYRGVGMAVHGRIMTIPAVCLPAPRPYFPG